MLKGRRFLEILRGRREGGGGKVMENGKLHGMDGANTRHSGKK